VKRTQRRAAAGRGLPPRADHSGSLAGRGGDGPDSTHARLHSTRRIGLSRPRGGQSLTCSRGAVLTAGRGQCRATAGAGRDAARSAAAFPDAVTVSVPATVSGTATSGGSCTVPPTGPSPTTPTPPPLAQRG